MESIGECSDGSIADTFNKLMYKGKFIGIRVGNLISFSIYS